MVCFLRDKLKSQFLFFSLQLDSIFVFSGHKFFLLVYYLTFEVFVDTNFVHSGLKGESR